MTGDPPSAGGELSAVFLAALDRAAATTSTPDLEATLLLLLDQARAAWPELALDRAVFVRHLAGRVPEGADLERALSQLHAADLYLACACQHDVPGAIARFEQAFAPTVVAFLRHIDRSPAFADEVRQILHQKLFVAASADAPPRIAGYSGRGPLSSWVGVAAQRTGISLLRGAAARPHGGDDALAESLPAGVDPELDYLKTRYKTEFREAFRVAFAALSQRERVILRLSVVNGLSHEDIAAMYRVNQSTVTRWISKAREAIAATAQRHLRDRLQVTTAEFNSLGHLVASQLDLSITRWLGDD